MKVEPELRGMQQRCDSCRSAPCAFYCRADSASLCAACDAEVHSANTLASRHRRVPMGVAAVAAPVSPAGGAFVVRPGGANSSSWPIREGRRRYYDDGEEEDEEATSWLLLDPPKGSEGHAAPAYGDAMVADFLDLGGTGEKDESSKQYCRSQGININEASHELVVPGEQLQERQCFTGETAYGAQNFQHGYGFGATFERSLSMSSLSPDNSSTVQDVSSSYLRRSESSVDLFSTATAHMSPQFMAMDREARVNRYREKRKMRRFEKTIRYVRVAEGLRRDTATDQGQVRQARRRRPRGGPVLLRSRAVRLQLRRRAHVLGRLRPSRRRCKEERDILRGNCGSADREMFVPSLINTCWQPLLNLPNFQY